VWCEGVRIFLDPTSSHFSPSNALKALNYSAFFTPQYGDIIIEVMIDMSHDPRAFV
jgi:singapore isolate B (sub-type 7) whole genome shotgun sequence assembly, scaffold_9